MKMKILDRLILRLGALLTLLTGALAIAGGFVMKAAFNGLNPAPEFPKNLLPVALIVAGIVTVLVSLYDMLLPRRYNPRRRAFVTQPTEHGELRIAVSAIENLILRCVEMHKEVKVLAMQITNRRGAVNVNMRVAVNSNISIPHAVEQLQTQIKRYLAASSGIEVREIGVSVERATGDESALPAEPLQRAVVENEAPAEEKKEKISVHQRIFGRDTSKSVAEQVTEAEAVAEPAVPEAQQEAPAEETAEESVEETAETAETVEEAAEVDAQTAETECESAKEQPGEKNEEAQA
ncbi:MAG: alkaline shock response membrane anchor protein AmaP [Clostridia bacterium]|nr:alkaline shock response membrane anchor protein AmaP [Clostridia bacterium]